MICAKPQSAPGALIGKVIRGGIVKVRKKFRTASERLNRALQEPEPPALKGARAVLRGRGCGNTPLLPDFSVNTVKAEQSKAERVFRNQRNERVKRISMQ